MFMTALGWSLGVNVLGCLFKSSCLVLCQQNKKYTRRKAVAIPSVSDGRHTLQYGALPMLPHGSAGSHAS